MTRYDSGDKSFDNVSAGVERTATLSYGFFPIFIRSTTVLTLFFKKCSLNMKTGEWFGVRVDIPPFQNVLFCNDMTIQAG